MKKTYRDYKRESPVVFTSYAYVFSKGWVLLVLSLVGIVGLGAVFYKGYSSFKDAVTPPVEEKQYLEINSANTAGMTWGKTIASFNPTEGNWAVSESTKTVHPFDTKVCPSFKNLPPSAVSSYTASGKGVEFRVQVHGAGQAKKAFDNYVKLIGDCNLSYTEEKDKDYSALFIGGGFMVVTGDAIYSVYGDGDKVESLYDTYLNKVRESLKESQCLSLDLTAQDSSRSLYYGKDNYKGLSETVSINTVVDTSLTPNVIEPELHSIEVAYVDKPENPLPENFPAQLPESVQQPSLPETKAVENVFVEKATYEIADEKGPGCGWEWSAQKSPVYNYSLLENSKNTILNDSQSKANTKAENYIFEKTNSELDYLNELPKVDKWNSYVNEVNHVHSRWLWLNTKREELYQPWHQYVEEHRYWSTFDERKAEATRVYEQELAQCKAKIESVKEWEEKWGELYKKQEEDKRKKATPKPTSSPSTSSSAKPTVTPEPSPTASSSDKSTVIPPKPETCLSAPVRPSIVDEQKPSEPQPPYIEQGVTIPDSWEKP